MKLIKQIIIAILLILAYLISGAVLCHSFGQCSIYGDKPVRRFQILDSLKNRNFCGEIDSTVNLETILSFQGDDRNIYSSDQYVQLEGYVILVKYGSAETCNCHSKNKNDLDIHIELALTPTSKGSEAMVCEINRYTKVGNSNFTLENVKKLIGKKVCITGFLFYDSEHWANSVTSNPKGTNLWRYSTLELHPVMKIELIK